MSNLYQPSDVVGSKYARAYRIEAQNPLDGVPSITFAEEVVYAIEGNGIISKQTGNLNESLSLDNVGTEFDLLNPITGEAVGAKMTYGQLQAALYSLYIHLAKERDSAGAEN